MEFFQNFVSSNSGGIRSISISRIPANKYIISFAFVSTYIATLLYKYYVTQINFKRLDKYYPRTLKWERDLKIYKVAMPLFYTHTKKKKCVLLISGFRDVPYVWEKLVVFFEINRIDYYAPRTSGSGRSFFQYTEPNDWVITYMEAIKVLEQQYEQIDIIAFSAGCIIALYLSQFEYKCKIRNIILCAPYLQKYMTLTHYLAFDSYWSYIINPLIRFYAPLRIKTCCPGFKYTRDTHNELLARTDFYDIVGYFEMENLLMGFKETRPVRINADNVVMLYPNDDKVIGDIYKQQKIVNKIFTKREIPVIKIPSNSEKLCGHVMFKEGSDVIGNIFDNIKKYIV